jgi:integrase
VLGKVKLSDLDPRRVDAFTRALTEKGVAARTSQYSYSVLRRALQFAVDWKYIAANPASARMRAAKRNQVKELSKIRFLAPNEARTFLKAVRGDRYEALYVLALTTGMRQGELLGLQWPDIDLDAGKITVSRALHRTKRRRDPEDRAPWFELRRPKTAGSRRSLEIPPVTVEALRGHLEKQKQQRLLADTSWKEQGLIFTTRTGTPVDTTNVLHQYQEILKRAGLQSAVSGHRSAGRKKTLPAFTTPNRIGTSDGVSQFEHGYDGNSDLFVASLHSHRLEELACAFALTFDGNCSRRVEHQSQAGGSNGSR